ncbi:uncharacterized protein V6R79_017000 [Siganus canaliculatus]
MWIFAAVFILLTAGLRAEDYDNSLGGLLLRVCPSNQVVSRVKSSHESSENDRQWKFECKTLDARENCVWSGFHDLNEKELSFNCPANRVISAVFSLYQNGDRRWNIFCCSVPNLITFDCRDTPKINYFNEDFDWHVPGDNFLTGIHTHGKNNDGVHNKDQKDRLFGISCKAFTASTTCHWSGYVNNYWDNINFACPDNHVITGVYSKYGSILLDRRWKFRCCRANGFSTFNCNTTPKINYWNEFFNWKVPGSNFLTGVRSSFDPDTLKKERDYRKATKPGEVRPAVYFS